jgi:hypothetical protein
VKQVKPVPGIFSGLSENIQNWKWPPAMTTPEDEEDQLPPALDEPLPLPPPPLPSSAPPLPLQPPSSASSSQRSARPKSATSDLSASDASYLYPLSVEDLETVGTPPPGTSHSQRPSSSPGSSSAQQPSRRRHSFSVDSRRKIQLHPTIVRKRMSEEDATTPSSSRLGAQFRTAEDSVRPSPSPSPTTSGLHPSLEMLAADDFDAHYRSSPEQPPTVPRVQAPRQRGQGGGESQEPRPPSLPSSPPKTPKRPANGSALLDLFNATPSRHYEMDFAATLEQELESFLVAHDLHEVSPPKGQEQEQQWERRGTRQGRAEEEREEESDALELPRESEISPQRHRSQSESWNGFNEKVETPLPSSTPATPPHRPHSKSPRLPLPPPHIIASPVKIIISRDLVKLGYVPPPPSTPPPSYPSPPSSSSSPLTPPPVAPPEMIDHSTSTDLLILLQDRATNTPLPTPLNPDPCPHCTLAKNEIIILKNEVSQPLPPSLLSAPDLSTTDLATG